MQNKQLFDPDVDLINPDVRKVETLASRMSDKVGLQYAFYPSSFRLAKHPWFIQADIVQLYNIHGGYFTPRALPLLSKQKPIVWRLSDMWPYTGQCTYAYDCNGWKNGCGQCSRERLQEFPSLTWDTSALLWHMKRKAYRRSNLHIVAPSKWMERLVKESPLLGHFPLYRIPNGVDIDVYRPVDRVQVRKELEIPDDLPLVLFSADSLTDHRKGGEYLKRALSILFAKNVRFRILTMGKGEITGMPYPTHMLGRLEKDIDIARAYAVSDLFVLPTLAENLPNAVLESMACGTPAVSFDVGGVPDAVRHMETGYLAVHKDAEDLARGIEQLLQDTGMQNRLADNARSVVISEFTDKRQTEAFFDLYQSILTNSHHGEVQSG